MFASVFSKYFLPDRLKAFMCAHTQVVNFVQCFVATHAAKSHEKAATLTMALFPCDPFFETATRPSCRWCSWTCRSCRSRGSCRSSGTRRSCWCWRSSGMRNTRETAARAPCNGSTRGVKTSGAVHYSYPFRVVPRPRKTIVDEGDPIHVFIINTPPWIKPSNQFAVRVE